MSGMAKSLGIWGTVCLLSVTILNAADDLRLLDAAKQGDRAAVRALLNEGADVNAAQPDGETALHWAANRGDLETADLLIGAGANVNATNDYGVTPLALSCAGRNAGIVQRLLHAQADPNLALWTGETPLMACAKTGNLDAVNALLDHGADVNAAESEKGQTALMWAVANQHPEIAQALIAGGADVRARSKVVSLPEPFVVPCTPTSPCANGQTEGTTYPPTVHFPETAGGFTPLLFAAQQGDVESARLLLAAGVDVNESTPEDGSALVVASASGHQELALFLLEMGADPNARDGFGVTPLHYALHGGMLALSVFKPAPTDQFGWKRSNMPELAKALLAHGADPNARIAHDFPPYDYPLLSRSRGLNLAQLTLAGATPFLLATATADLELMRVLVEGRANPQMGTTDGNTPLMIAAGIGRERGGYGFGGQVGEEYQKTGEEERRFLEAVKLTFELSNSDVNAVNERGQTALHAATFMGHKDVIRFLAEKGANLDMKDKYGQTPVSIALGDPEGLVFRQLPGGQYDYSFRQPKLQEDIADLLVNLGAKPFTGEYRDRSGQ